MLPLETHRLILRKMQPPDAQDLFELNKDPDVLLYTGDKPFASIDEAKNFIEKYYDNHEDGYGRLSVFLKENNKYIGWCGLKYHKDENQTEVGYRLKKQFWNRGFATEAALACLHHGFTTLNLPIIYGRVMKENDASIRVLEKIGLNYFEEKMFDEDPGWHYCIKRDEFKLPSF
jgi:RimJ/RimL family protein N-acetyltransferase